MTGDKWPAGQCGLLGWGKTDDPPGHRSEVKRATRRWVRRLHKREDRIETQQGCVACQWDLHWWNGRDDFSDE